MNKHTLLLVSLVVLLGTPAQALASPPAQRLVVPASAGESYNAAYAVALGERFALLGSPESTVKGQPGSYHGEVFVFNAPSGAYLKRLIAPTPKSGDKFGYAVAVSGSTAFITALNNEDGGADAGCVYALDIPTGKLLWKHTGQPNQRVGLSIAVDGDDVVVGGYGEVNGGPDRSGSLVHLNRHSGALIATYVSPIPQEYGGFGDAVAVSGRIAVCGAPTTNINGKSHQGMIAVIDLAVGHVNWLTSADGLAWDLFGHSVAIAGGRILVGAKDAATPGKDNGGAAYLYDLASLSLITKILPPAAVSANAGFGSAVDLSGNFAAIGAKNDSASYGSAWLLDLTTLQLTECAKRPKHQSKEFGSCLAMSQNSLLIGDPEYSVPNQSPNGAAWLVGPLRQNFGSGLQTIARSGDHAPGTEGAVFHSFGEAALSATGKVIHTATLRGHGVKRTNQHGVWDTLSGTLDLVLRSGTSTSTGISGPTERPFFDQSGNALFLNRQTNGKRSAFIDASTYAFHMLTEGSPRTFLIPGLDASQELTVHRIQRLSGRPTNGGEIMANLIVKLAKGKVARSNDSLIAFNQPGFAVAVREGDASPISGSSYGQLLPRLAVAGTQMLYATGLQNSPTTGNQAVFIKTHGMNDAAVIARKGDLAHGTDNARFSAFLGEGVVGGKVILRASVRGGSPKTQEGLWSNRDGSLKAVALTGQQAPGLAIGVKFKRFQKYFLTTAQDSIVFQAQVSGPGITAANDTGVWFSSLIGNVFLLMAEGQGAPDATGASIGVLQRLEVDPAGNYLILASLKGAPTSNQALYLGSIANGSLARRLPMLALRKGSLFDRPGAEQLKSLSLGTNNLDASGCGSSGLARLINASGPIFTAEFTDGAKELLFGKP